MRICLSLFAAAASAGSTFARDLRFARTERDFGEVDTKTKKFARPLCFPPGTSSSDDGPDRPIHVETE